MLVPAIQSRSRQRIAQLLRKCAVLGVLAMCIGPLSTAGAGTRDVSVYAHPSVDSAFLTRNFLRAIFTLRVRTWPDGQPIRIFVLDDSDPLHIQFCQDQLGTYPYVLRKSWNRTTFTGTGLLPVRVDSIEDMRRKVDRTPGAIGYVPTMADADIQRSPS